MEKANIKKNVLTKIIEIIDTQIDATKIALAAAKESRDNETKCSVGDKYETSRTMMQLEVEKNRVLLNQSLEIKSKLARIHPYKANKTVGFGSLVFTNHQNYFIAIAIGKINISNHEFYCISLASPIGKLLKDKKAGEIVEFRSEKITITEVK